MPLEIVFGLRAERDLDHIDDLLADYSQTAAERLIEHIHERCARLADFPMAGKDRSDLGEDLRSFAIPGKVTVIYHVDAARLTVLRVLYAGRDVDGAVGEDSGR